MGGIQFSLKLEGQVKQCMFHAFPQGPERITHALSICVGRHGFSFPLDAEGMAFPVRITFKRIHKLSEIQGYILNTDKDYIKLSQGIINTPHGNL